MNIQEVLVEQIDAAVTNLFSCQTVSAWQKIESLEELIEKIQIMIESLGAQRE